MNLARYTFRLVTTLLPSLFAIHAGAVNLVTNGSFENATSLVANSTLAPGATNLSGWEVIGSGNLIWCNSSAYCARPASDGTYSLDLTGLTNIAPYAGVSQSISTTPGVRYQFEFALAGRSDSTPVSVVAAAGPTIQTFFNASSEWSLQSLYFIATTIETSVSLTGLSAGLSGLIIQVDNVQVQASPVPEPASWALLAAGILALGAASRFLSDREYSRKPGR